MLFHSENLHFIRHIKKQIFQERRIPWMPIPGQLTSLVNYIKRSCGRAALCTSASLTVEAAVILPLFLIGMLTMVSVIDVCQIQVIQQTELAEKAKKLSMYAYLSGGNLSSDYIDLSEVEICELPVTLIPGYKIKLALRGRVHAWTGRSETECAADVEYVSEEMVYVTENLSVYHTDSNCTHLELSIYGVAKGELSSKRNEDGRKYHACEKCCDSVDSVNVYYISESGECYHTSQACSGLIRKVRLIRKSEVAGLYCCSRCQGG